MKQMVRCGACGEHFEMQTGIGNIRINRAYCSEECRIDGYRERIRVRQANFRQRFIRQHGIKALRERYRRYEH